MVDNACERCMDRSACQQRIAVLGQQPNCNHGRRQSAHVAYGINGAHEDNGSDVLYTIQALIIQGLHEDGVAPTSGCFASAAYTFEHDDNVKYYIKSESAQHGLATSYLTAVGGVLKWKEAISADVLADDAFAWYLSFDPTTQFYSLRNASTGQYITCDGSFKTKACSVPTANEQFQFILGRKDVKVGSGTSAVNVRGYWIAKANGGSATAMTAANGGGVSASGFNLSADAATQHWVILTAEETEAFDGAARVTGMNNLKRLVAGVKAMVAVPHTEKVAGTDDAIGAVLANATMVAEDERASIEAVQEAYNTTWKAMMTFIANASPSDLAVPFDLTFLMADPSITTGDGWETSKDIQQSCIEYFEQSFDFYQTIKGIPAGTYKLMVQGFNRPGNPQVVYADYQNGKNNSAAFMYAGTSSLKISHLAKDASATRLHTDDLLMTSPTAYVPNTISSAVAYFEKGLYENEMVFEVKTAADIKVGVRQGTVVTQTWTFFDNFRLYGYGDAGKDAVTDIQEVEHNTENATEMPVFNLQGMKVGDSVEGLPRGIYIRNKKKIFVK